MTILPLAYKEKPFQSPLFTMRVEGLRRPSGLGNHIRYFILRQARPSGIAPNRFILLNGRDVDNHEPPYNDDANGKDGLVPVPPICYKVIRKAQQIEQKMLHHPMYTRIIAPVINRLYQCHWHSIWENEWYISWEFSGDVILSYAISVMLDDYFDHNQEPLRTMDDRVNNLENYLLDARQGCHNQWFDKGLIAMLKAYKEYVALPTGPAAFIPNFGNGSRKRKRNASDRLTVTHESQSSKTYNKKNLNNSE